MQIKKEVYTQIKNKLQEIIDDINYNIKTNAGKIAHLAHNQKVSKKERRKLNELKKGLYIKDENSLTFIEKEVHINIKCKLQGSVNDINRDIEDKKRKITNLTRKKNEMKKELSKQCELMYMLK